MQYNKKDIFEKSKKLEELTLEQGFNLINKEFKTEKDFIDNLLPKLKTIIKEMYGFDVKSIEQEKHFNLREQGYFNAFFDIVIETEQNVTLIIECKNPKQKKYEIISACSQLMSYDFLMQKTTDKKYKIILATSFFEFKYLEFMAMFNLKYDIILNNENTSAFWINNIWKQ